MGVILRCAGQAAHCCDFSYCGAQASVAVVPGLRCSEAGGICLWEGIKPVSPKLQADSLALSPQGSPDGNIIDGSLGVAKRSAPIDHQHFYRERFAFLAPFVMSSQVLAPLLPG